jgi:hypothetical protein
LPVAQALIPPARHGPSDGDARGCQHRDVIDPKYDSCTKLVARLPLKKILAAEIRKPVRASVFLNQRTATDVQPIM